MFAHSHEHMGNPVYLCERGYHLVLSADGSVRHRAAVQTTRVEAALQTLGIPDRADSFRRHEFMDRVGIGHGKSQRFPDRARYSLPWNTRVLDLAHAGCKELNG